MIRHIVSAQTGGEDGATSFTSITWLRRAQTSGKVWPLEINTTIKGAISTSIIAQ